MGKDKEQRKLLEKTRRILQTIQSKCPENGKCADCESDKVTAANVRIGCFICGRCSGIHRRMAGADVEAVKTFNLETWREGDLQMMREWGNKRVNKLYNPIKKAYSGRSFDNDRELEKYIRQKYEEQAFETASPITAKHDNNSVTSSGGGNYRGNSSQISYTSEARTLQSMGFTDLSKNLIALNKSNGSVDAAVEILIGTADNSRDNSLIPESSPSPGPPKKKQSRSISPLNRREKDEENDTEIKLCQLISMGWEDNVANMAALEKSSNNVEKAVSFLQSKKNSSSAARKPNTQNIQNQQNKLNNIQSQDLHQTDFLSDYPATRQYPQNVQGQQYPQNIQGYPQQNQQLYQNLNPFNQPGGYNNHSQMAVQQQEALLQKQAAQQQILQMQRLAEQQQALQMQRQVLEQQRKAEEAAATQRQAEQQRMIEQAQQQAQMEAQRQMQLLEQQRIAVEHQRQKQQQQMRIVETNNFFNPQPQSNHNQQQPNSSSDLDLFFSSSAQQDQQRQSATDPFGGFSSQSNSSNNNFQRTTSQKDNIMSLYSTQPPQIQQQTSFNKIPNYQNYQSQIGIIGTQGMMVNKPPAGMNGIGSNDSLPGIKHNPFAPAHSTPNNPFARQQPSQNNPFGF